MTTNVLYRYELEYKSYDGDTNIRLRQYRVIDETDKTFVIEVNPWTKKRIHKNAANTYAYADKDDALDHFKRRTAKRISWFEFWIDECKKGLELANEIEVGDE